MMFRKKKRFTEENSELLRLKTEVFINEFIEEEADGETKDINNLMAKIRKKFSPTEVEFLAAQFVIKTSLEHLMMERLPTENQKDKEMMYR